MWCFAISLSASVIGVSESVETDRLGHHVLEGDASTRVGPRPRSCTGRPAPSLSPLLTVHRDQHASGVVLPHESGRVQDGAACIQLERLVLMKSFTVSWSLFDAAQSRTSLSNGNWGTLPGDSRPRLRRNTCNTPTFPLSYFSERDSSFYICCCRSFAELEYPTQPLNTPLFGF